MNQQDIRRTWIVFIIISNAVFLGYLVYYQNPGGLLLGLPETWVVLFVLMVGVFVTNSVFAWYYLDKPDIGQVFGGSPKQEGDL